LLSVERNTQSCSEETILFNVSLHNREEGYKCTYCHGLGEICHLRKRLVVNHSFWQCDLLFSICGAGDGTRTRDNLLGR